MLSGTPTTPGSYNFNVTGTDGVDTIFRSTAVNVFAVRITTAAVLPNATQGLVPQHDPVRRPAAWADTPSRRSAACPAG